MTEDVAELIASGADVYVATRDDALEPESMLGMGARTHTDRSILTVYLPTASVERTRRNLVDNGEIAVTVIRPSDLRSVQIKGVATVIRESDETDREFQSIFRGAFIEQMAVVGVPRTMTRRLIWWPSLAVTVKVREVFLQTPGPRAGEPLVAR